DLKRFDATIVHVHPDRVAVSAMYLGVDVDHGLRVVVAGRKVGERHRIANRAVVDDSRLRGTQLVEIDAEDRWTLRRDEHARLGLRVLREDEDETPGERCGVRGRGKAHLEARRRRARWGRMRDREGECEWSERRNAIPHERLANGGHPR